MVDDKEIKNLEKALAHIKIDDILRTEIFEKVVKFILKRQKDNPNLTKIDSEEDFKMACSSLILELEILVNKTKQKHLDIGDLD